MTRLTGQKRAAYVQNMFSRIAGRYDLMNRLMTAGQDVRWRKQVIRRAQLKNDSCLLDIGTGTGDLAREALAQYPQSKVIAADFTLEMMRVGQKNGALDFSSADTLSLPFGDETFDALVSGFLIRNVVDLPQALQEQYRVLKKGGHLVILDTTRPKKNILSPLIWLHMHFIIPSLGRLLTGSGEAYRYLPETTESFLAAEDLASRLSAAGFQNIHFQRFMFGTIAIHWAQK
jgi:demethylmenaquinone methyltransferase / 2-methoxy-6-polyprenyl-1,4-benzoquinol methylase